MTGGRASAVPVSASLGGQETRGGRRGVRHLLSRRQWLRLSGQHHRQGLVRLEVVHRVAVVLAPDGLHHLARVRLQQVGGDCEGPRADGQFHWARVDCQIQRTLAHGSTSRADRNAPSSHAQTDNCYYMHTCARHHTDQPSVLPRPG